MMKVAITFLLLALIFYACAVLLFKLYREQPEYGYGFVILLAGALGTACLGAAVVSAIGKWQ